MSEQKAIILKCLMYYLHFIKTIINYNILLMESEEIKHC